MNHLQETIERAWTTKSEWDFRSASAEVRDGVEHTIQLLDAINIASILPDSMLK